jgi:hypothetical protein
MKLVFCLSKSQATARSRAIRIVTCLLFASAAIPNLAYGAEPSARPPFRAIPRGPSVPETIEYIRSHEHPMHFSRAASRGACPEEIPGNPPLFQTGASKSTINP